MSTLDTSGRVLTGWNPEEPENWSAKIAWTTLAITTFSLMLGFTVWFLPSAVAPRLNDVGFHLTKNQIYWITSMPGLSCAALRLVYMFLPATIGARKMIGWSSLLYILPMLGWFFAVQNHDTSFGVLLALSFACGIGAATFSGYMPSTGFYFPKRLAGTALGLQGGLGNMGMSVIQLAAPFLMSISLFGLTWVAPHHEGAPMVVNATVFFLPWSLIAAFLTFRYIKDVPLKANIKEQMDIFGNLDTWLMTVLYIMTFGVFSGFAAQTANIINNNYGAASDLAKQFAASDLPQGASYAFIGTLIGSFLRFAWGPLCDRFGGAIWTFISIVGRPGRLHHLHGGPAGHVLLRRRRQRLDLQADADDHAQAPGRRRHRLHRRGRLARPLPRGDCAHPHAHPRLLLRLRRLLRRVRRHLLDPLRQAGRQASGLIRHPASAGPSPPSQPPTTD